MHTFYMMTTKTDQTVRMSRMIWIFIVRTYFFGLLLIFLLQFLFIFSFCFRWRAVLWCLFKSFKAYLIPWESWVSCFWFLLFCDDISCHLNLIQYLGKAGYRVFGFCCFAMTFHAIQSLFIALGKFGIMFVVFAVLWWHFMPFKAYSLP